MPPAASNLTAAGRGWWCCTCSRRSRAGRRAGLIGHTGRIVWTVVDDGWIFEARETNRDTAEFHGYPVLATEAIARAVFNRFSDWVALHGTPEDRSASDSCRLRYGFR